jgi:hypothetical protein
MQTILHGIYHTQAGYEVYTHGIPVAVVSYLTIAVYIALLWDLPGKLQTI